MFCNIKFNLLICLLSGVLSLLVVNPVFVAKTRLCLQYEQTSDIHKKTYYRGLSDALVKIFKQEGFKGFYKVNSFISLFYLIPYCSNL